MSYATVIDLRDLADEYEALLEQAVTCGVCDGEGEIEGPNGVTEGCLICGGEGEYVPDNKEELPDYDYDRLQTLEQLDGEFGGLRDHARNEPTAILEADFELYAQELAQDMGVISDNAEWPLYCIDWERAARDLANDYNSFELDGDTYLTRAY